MSEDKYGRKMPTPAEQAAQRAFRQVDGVEALSEYARAQRAFHTNYQRLKAERVAREAASGRSDSKKRCK
jgi:hypothetical protein